MHYVRSPLKTAPTNILNPVRNRRLSVTFSLAAFAPQKNFQSTIIMQRVIRLLECLKVTMKCYGHGKNARLQFTTYKKWHTINSASNYGGSWAFATNY